MSSSQMPGNFGQRIGRREFLPSALAGLLVPVAGRAGDVSNILSRIRPPRFPARDFDVRRYGGVNNGKTDCCKPFASAIAECHSAGGGRVVVPPGTYLSNGPIRLTSNVNLHLEEGATVVFGTNPADYLPTVLVRWESTRCYNYSPLIYAYDQENISITGAGVFDGQAQASWGEWKVKQSADQEKLRDMGRRGVPVQSRVFGSGHYLRPTMCEFYSCRNVLLERVTFKSSPFWTVHPVFCTNVLVRGIHVQPGTTNDDGCDPDSCRDVLIENCTFDTADDNISIKAGRDQDAWGGWPCENVVIRRCRGIRSDANAYTIGSEMSGNVRNVWILDAQVDQVAQSVLYIKSNGDRGGTVENVWARHITANECGNCIELQTNYKGVQGHRYPSQYRNLHFEDIACRHARKIGISSVGTTDKPIDGVYLKNITIESAAGEMKIANTRHIEIQNVRVNGRLVAQPQRQNG